MTKYHRQFLLYLKTWQENLGSPGLDTITAGDPSGCALLSVDLINGFCTEGLLSSPRVQAIVDPVTAIMRNAWNKGVRHLLLLQDSHEPDAVEFGAFAPHCIKGTSEAETVPEIKTLPFYDNMLTLSKNSIASGFNSELTLWLSTHREVHTFIVVGDCTDLCTYQLAMHLRLDANASQLKRRVIVPADCAATYDMSVEKAEKLGVFPHDGDLLQTIFLYHMALNGIEVVQSIVD